MKVANNLLELIGSTPMVRLNKVVDDCEATIMVKLEYYNPSFTRMVASQSSSSSRRETSSSRTRRRNSSQIRVRTAPSCS